MKSFPSENCGNMYVNALHPSVFLSLYSAFKQYTVGLPFCFNFQLAPFSFFSSLTVNMNLHLAALNYSIWTTQQHPCADFLKTVEYKTGVEL